MMSNFLHHGACAACGSSDANSFYDDGHEHCFSCGETKRGDSKISQKTKVEDRPLTSLPLKEMPALKARKLDSSTVNKYKVTVNLNPDSNVEAVFPRFNDEGEHVANQVRFAEKDFRCEGDIKGAGLFGQNLFPIGGKSITITEGYYDTMAAFQLTGSRYPNVGVMSASTAKREVVDNFEYINSFGEIIVNFDNDEPGVKAAKEVAQLFQPGKVRLLKLERKKDANDYLMSGLVKEYINEWFRAPPYMPDGLQLGNDPKLLDDIVNYKEPHSIAYPWKGLNKATYGLRLSEFTLFTAETGIGKTTFMKEIEYALLQDPELKERGYGVGFLHLEESKRDTALGLMSIHKNKPYHLPDTAKSDNELIEAYNDVVNTDRVVIYDHFGSNDIETILAKIRHMTALGCRYIVLDHLSIVVSDQSGDERKQLDEISTKLKTLTMNLNICVVAVIHVNRQGQVRGSAGPEQVANNIVRLERDKKETDEWRRNITRIVVEKCRLSGRTGAAAYVFYNPITGRLEEMSDEEISRFESGGNNTGYEFDSYTSGVSAA